MASSPACRAGRSVFFTGCAGTGKSLLLRHILAALPAGSTFATASTGLAACALGGTTLNAFAGVGRAEVRCHRAPHVTEHPSRWYRSAHTCDAALYYFLSVVQAGSNGVAECSAFESSAG